MKDGCWDSIHVVEVQEGKDGKATYKLTTTVMLSMVIDKDSVGEANLSGSLTRQKELTTKVDEVENSHICNIGKLIEDMETNIRTRLDELYIKKTQTIINGMRKTDGGADQQKAFIESMNKAVLSRPKAK